MIRNILITISLFFLCIGGSLSVYFLNRLSLNEAILGVVTDSYRFPPKDIFFYYIKFFRKIEVSDDDLHPLHFTLNGCYENISSDKDCKAMIDLILNNSELSINDLSNHIPRLRPLHVAVLFCSPEAVKYILERGADVNLLASIKNFGEVTALQLLDKLKRCNQTSQIRSLLSTDKEHL